MTLQEFQNWALGQGQVGNPGTATPQNPMGTYPGQCVSLVQCYLYHVYGIGYMARGDAKDWPTNANVLSYFDKVSTLKDGDIIVYGSDYGAGYGHIGIKNGGFLDQNGHKPLHVATGAVFSNPIAYLRRKGATPGGNEVTDLYTCRRIAYSVWGMNGIYSPVNAINGDMDEAFKKDSAWLGADTNECLQTRFDAPEGAAYRAWLAKQTGTDLYTPVTEQLFKKK